MERIVGYYGKLLPKADPVRSDLSKLPISSYDWYDDPRVQKRIKKIAGAEYHAGGSDEVERIIDEMDLDQLKNWLKNMASKDMELGIRILSNGGEQS